MKGIELFSSLFAVCIAHKIKSPCGSRATKCKFAELRPDHIREGGLTRYEKVQTIHHFYNSIPVHCTLFSDTKPELIGPKPSRGIKALEVFLCLPHPTRSRPWHSHRSRRRWGPHGPRISPVCTRSNSTGRRNPWRSSTANHATSHSPGSASPSSASSTHARDFEVWISSQQHVSFHLVIASPHRGHRVKFPAIPGTPVGIDTTLAD